MFSDEAFSARVAKLSVPDAWTYVSQTDPHPPLYYLMLKPVEMVSTSEWALRLPSALCACAAVAAVAWWQRHRGFEGVVVTLLFALAPTLLHYSHQARMYGLMMLVGVLAAWAASSWVDDPRRRWVVVAGLAGLVAAFSHAVGPILLGGLLLVPGLRRDRTAIEWRAAMAGGLALYGATWASNTLRWRSQSLYQAPTLDSLTTTVNELMAAVPSNRMVQLALLAAGGVVLWTRRDAMARTWFAMFLVPTAALAVIALRVPMFIPKSLLVISWGVPVAVGAIAGWAARRTVLFGALVLAVQLFLIVPFISVAIDSQERTDEIVPAVLAQVRDGDLVVAHGGGVVTWYLVETDDGRIVPTSSAPAELTTADVETTQLGTAPPTGRVWVVDSGLGSAPLTVRAGRPCSAPAVYNSTWMLRCFDYGAPTS